MKLQRIDGRWKKNFSFTAWMVLTLLLQAGLSRAQNTADQPDFRVDGVTPGVFGAGAEIVINGSGFLAEDTVSLGPIKLEITDVNASTIRAKVPEKAKRGPKLIFKRANAKGRQKKIATFTEFTFAPAPKAARTKPTFGTPGESVKLTGANLDTIEKLTIGATAIKIESKSKRSLSFLVPNGLKTGPLTVTGPGGSASLKRDFEVFYPPVIESVQPLAAFPGTDVTVNGSHFDTKGIKFKIGKRALKPKTVSATRTTFTIPKNAKTDKIKAIARRKTAESKSAFTVYAAPVISRAPKMVSSPGTLKVNGKNLDTVERWSINGHTLKVDTTFKRNSARQVQLVVPEDMNASGQVTATYLNENFAAKKATTIATTPFIGAVRFQTDASGKNCEYIVLGKNFSQNTVFKLGNKKLTASRITDNDAMLTAKGTCLSRKKQMTAQNGKFKGNKYGFDPKANGFTTTPEEAASRLNAGDAEYTPWQIQSDLDLMSAHFQGSAQSWVAKGKTAAVDTGQQQVEQASKDVGDALLRLALAEQSLCAAMAPGKGAAKANADYGRMLDQVTAKEKQLMNDVLIPLWSKLPRASMAKKIDLSTVDGKVLTIASAKAKTNSCKGKFYGKRLVAEASKVAAVNLSELHEKALMGALSNLSTTSTNTVVASKSLNDALYSFDNTRRTYWVNKAQKELNKVQQSQNKTVGKGAGKNRRVNKSSKQKPAGNTGR